MAAVIVMIAAVVVFVVFCMAGVSNQNMNKRKYRNDTDSPWTGSYFWRDSADGHDGGGFGGGDGGGGGGE